MSCTYKVIELIFLAYLYFFILSPFVSLMTYSAFLLLNYRYIETKINFITNICHCVYVSYA